MDELPFAEPKRVSIQPDASTETPPCTCRYHIFKYSNLFEYMSRIMRKYAVCTSENKGADSCALTVQLLISPYFFAKL